MSVTPIQLYSNVKRITSGNIPTTANLNVGELAFGMITATNSFRLFGNSDGTIREFDVSVPTLDEVLTSGNTSEGTIVLENSDGTVNIMMSAANGFQDNGTAVLTANPTRTITTTEAGVMRTKLDVYTRAEVDAMVVAMLHFRGTVDTFGDLPTSPSVGDVWKALDTGILWVWAGATGSEEWIDMGSEVDMANFYTRTEVDALLTTINNSITTINTNITNLQTDVAAAGDLTLNDVLDNGNTSALSATVGAFTATGNVLLGGATAGDGIAISADNGIADQTYPVLSANPDTSRDLSTTQAAAMRTRLGVPSATEVGDMIPDVTFTIPTI